MMGEEMECSLGVLVALATNDARLSPCGAREVLRLEEFMKSSTGGDKDKLYTRAAILSSLKRQHPWLEDEGMKSALERLSQRLNRTKGDEAKTEELIKGWRSFYGMVYGSVHVVQPIGAHDYFSRAEFLESIYQFSSVGAEVPHPLEA